MTLSRSGGRARSEALLAWYDRNRRTLPWRAGPGEAADPYRVWLSEIMLQQTTTAVVGRYFGAFLARWPTVEALAQAPLDEVLREWAGLGYYARARNLHACAREVAGRLGGRFPDGKAGLQELPGVGPYTAAAIAAIAFGRRALALDGNAERVLARVFAVARPLPEGRRHIAEAAEPLVPAERPGDFAQALMDLGATVCTARKPRCLLCPLSASCEALRLGLQESLPKKDARSTRPTRRGTAFWIERQGCVLLRRRPDRGLLGGMLEVPSTEWTADPPPDPRSEAPVEARWRVLPVTVEHTFTHFHLVLDLWRAEEERQERVRLEGDYRWLLLEHLAEAALPSVMRKVVAAAGGAELLKRPLRRSASRQ